MAVYTNLARHGDALCKAMSDFAATLTARPALGHAARSALVDLGDDNTLRARLFPVVVHGAANGSPTHAVDACAVSSLWWSGVDRLAHAYGPHEMLRAVTSMTVLPQLYIERIPGKVRMRRAWTEAVTASSASVANRVLAVQRTEPVVVSREHALAHHFSLFGAAYARDAMLATTITSASPVENWRQFGLLYGLLQGIADDNSRGAGRPGVQEGSPPLLLLAHAFSVSARNRDQLARLRMESWTTPATRAVLNDLAHAKVAIRSYNQDVQALRRRAEATLTELAAPGKFRQHLEESIDAATQLALAQPREVVGAALAPELRRVAR